MSQPSGSDERAAAPITVRPEGPDDQDAVRAVHVAAFETTGEADLVERIRVSDRFIPALSLVAGDPIGRIVGHVLVSWVDLVGADGSRRPILDLGPIGVLPERQNRGIGAALMGSVIEEAERVGEPVIVLIGHPWYYPRFGFEPARPLGLEYPREIADEAWMVRRLTAWTPQLCGRVSYPPAWDGLV